MAFFDNLSKKLSDAGQSVSQQTKNLGEINRLNNLIAENRKGISQRCFELGKAYYQAHRDEENVEYPELVGQISELLKGIEEAEETIKQLKGITKCPSCGAEVVIDLNESSQARCHWCRNMLSVNSKVSSKMLFTSDCRPAEGRLCFKPDTLEISPVNMSLYS